MPRPHLPMWGPGERFITSAKGGVIIDKAGAPAGTVPAGSFVDRNSGTVYGPDSKAITVPDGGSIDLFDLPPLELLVSGARGGGHTPPPGKVGGAKGDGMHDGCGMDHIGPATKGGGLTTGVAGASGIGTTPGLQASLAELVNTLRQLAAALSGIAGGGGMSQLPPAKDAPKTEPPKTEPPKTEPPKTEPPKPAQQTGSVGGTQQSTSTDSSSSS